MNANDAVQLGKVILAVELRVETECNFQINLKPLDPICTGGEGANAIFFENFENAIPNWTTTNTAAIGNLTFTLRNWAITNAAPAGRPGKVAYGVNFQGGDCAGDFQNGVIDFESPVISIPNGSFGPFNMAFDHYFSIESGWDGGNVRYRINGGAYSIVPFSAFINNGYNQLLNPTSPVGSPEAAADNPNAGEPAFTGTNPGSVFGSWGQSRINLSTLGLTAGQTIQFKWELSSDGCGGVDGWYIDDVRVYSCAQPTVQFATLNSSTNEAEATILNNTPNQCQKYIEKIVTIKINKNPSAPVTVTMNAPTGTATLGNTFDYSFSPNSFVFDPAGATSQDITVRIYNDGYVEGDENFILSYSLVTSGNAIPETHSQSHIFTITDDDLSPGIVNLDLFSAKFNTGGLIGWTITDNLTSTEVLPTFPDTWGIVSAQNLTLDPSGRPFLMINSDQAGNKQIDPIYIIDQTITSPAFNTVGMSSITLSFDEYFKIYNDPDFNTFEEFATIEAWDGAAWHEIFKETELTGDSGSWTEPQLRNISIPIAYSNAAMKLRFRYAAEYDFWWAIDNINIKGKLPTQVQNTVNTVIPAQANLGPNATAVFYDPTSGDIIAKIENLSDFDYGCTSVAVDRAGNGETTWFGAYKISNKTFKVTPTNPNPAGLYKITFYYKAEELVGMTMPISSMGKSSGSILTGTTGLFAEAKSETIFNTDFSFTAIFDSGFSGFGLSTAPPIGALPVKLISFEGINSSDGNYLTWNTSAETDNEYFVIERSENAKDFQEIGKTKGNGNSVETNNYYFLDNKYVEGVNYYRLKQLDNNGKYGFSKIIAIESPKAKGIKFSPNPVQSILHITIPALNTEIVELKLINIQGREVLNKTCKVKDGQISQEVGLLTPGVYQAIISSNTNTYDFKMIKQ
jgi:Secretion system C-terminal sorting domain